MSGRLSFIHFSFLHSRYRYPLIDGTFFISPRQHTPACIQVKAEGRTSFLSAVCMACLEGWTCRLQCRNNNCTKVWDGSQLILGTMYSYDIFAAVPCCAERLKVSQGSRQVSDKLEWEYFSHCVCYQCTSCGQLVIHPEQRFNFFSDYSQTVSCPQCGVQDFHFVKPLKHSFLTKDDITRMNGINSNPVGLSSQMSWARITANS